MLIVLLLKGFIGSLSKTYRKWLADLLETFFYLNILFLVTFTWYSLDKVKSNQEVAAYISVSITFIVLLLIILYHVYMYTPVFSKVKKTKLGGMIEKLFDSKPNPTHHHWSTPTDSDDIHRFEEQTGELVSAVNTNDYATVPLIRPMEPTYSVVEVHQPRDLAQPDPK